MTAECQKSQTFYVIHLVHKQYSHFNENVLITNGSICTHPQFNVLSGGLIECLDEPQHVGVCVTGSLLCTNTLLSIPKWVISVESVKRERQLNVITSLTIVVTTKERRNLSINITIVGTNTCRKTY